MYPKELQDFVLVRRDRVLKRSFITLLILAVIFYEKLHVLLDSLLDYSVGPSISHVLTVGTLAGISVLALVVISTSFEARYAQKLKPAIRLFSRDKHGTYYGGLIEAALLIIEEYGFDVLSDLTFKLSFFRKDEVLDKWVKYGRSPREFVEAIL